MTLAVTMQFQLQDTGWSETHYYGSQSTDPSVLINDSGQATQDLLTLIAGRQAIMPFQAIAGNLVPQIGAFANQALTLTVAQLLNPRLLRVRVSRVDTGVPRQVRVINFPLGDQFGKFFIDPNTAPTNFTTEAWTRLECTSSMSVGLPGGGNLSAQGRVFLGGCPESQLGPPENVSISPQFSAALGIYFQALTGRYLSRLRPNIGLPAGPQAPFPITSFTLSTDGRSALVGTGLAGVLVGQGLAGGQFVIRGRHPSEWNGIHRGIVVPGAPGVFNIQLLGTRQPLADWVTTQQGTIQAFTPLYATLLRFTPLRWQHRPEGGPFGRPVGRRKRAR